MNSSTQWNPNTKYAQGAILSETVACHFGISGDNQVLIVISHDCDLVRDEITEPIIEVIVGNILEKSDGIYTNSKNPRQLHLEILRDGVTCHLELQASKKMNIKKADMIGAKIQDIGPNSAFELGHDNRVILQRWLAARYRRHSFPHELQKHLTPSFKKIEDLLKRSEKSILGIWVDYEPRNMELGNDEPYEVWVWVVANTGTAESLREANEIALRLRESLQLVNQIDLRHCDGLNDSEMTLKTSHSTFEYRLEYASLRIEPAGAMPEN